MPAHPLNYLDANLHGCAKVFSALYLVTLKEIVWTYLYFEKSVAQLRLSFNAVIDAAQQDTLVVHRNAATQQTVAGLSSFWSYLAGMVKVGIKPYGSVLRQHGT